MQRLIRALIIIGSGLILSCAEVPKSIQARLTVAAPEYLEGLLDTVAVQFKRDNDISVTFRFVHPDSILLLAQSDPAIDLFIINNPNRRDKLIKDSLLDKNVYSCAFRLSYVMVNRTNGPQCDDVKNWRDKSLRRVAIVNPQWEYEGYLAGRVLRKRRIYNDLQDKLIPARNSEHLLSFLNTGEADAALMFEFSIKDAQGLIIRQRFDDELKDYLVFCIGVTPHSKFKKSARAFLDLFDSRLCDLYKFRGVYQITGR
ncbi:MAG: substrate-binding domain-containing protein [Candidatus Zixiibacteriota bacterium]